MPFFHDEVAAPGMQMPAEDDAGVGLRLTVKALDNITGNLAGVKPSGMGHDAAHHGFHTRGAWETGLGKSFNRPPTLRFIPRVPCTRKICSPRFHCKTSLM
jgi:hypothetical protein